jgi:hypothetical protein
LGKSWFGFKNKNPRKFGASPESWRHLLLVEEAPVFRAGCQINAV